MAFDWADLLARIRLKRVTPVVGQELTRYIGDDADALGMPSGTSLDEYLTQRIVAKELLPATPPLRRLNDIVLHHRDKEVSARAEIRTALDESQLPVPWAIRCIAAVADFDLYVTTTFDSLLERAIQEQRHHRVRKTRRRDFDIYGRVEDYADSGDTNENCVQVYHLLGHYHNRGYALSEADAVEFVHRLQNPAPPRKLLNRLEQSDLLMLGLGYPDWLARMMMRVLVGRRLNLTRDTLEVLADDFTRTNPEAVMFFRHCHAVVVDAANVQDFAIELFQRWSATQQPAAQVDRKQLDTDLDDPPEERPEEGGIFISYCSEDAGAAEKMCAALEGENLATWYDRKQIKSGAKWRPMLHQAIAKSSLFVPLLSRTALKGLGRVYHQEWETAFDRNRAFFATGYRFIHPVIIDDLERTELPDEFASLQVEQFVDGVPSKLFIEGLRLLMREYQARGSRS